MGRIVVAALLLSLTGCANGWMQGCMVTYIDLKEQEERPESVWDAASHYCTHLKKDGEYVN